MKYLKMLLICSLLVNVKGEIMFKFLGFNFILNKIPFNTFYNI